MSTYYTTVWNLLCILATNVQDISLFLCSKHPNKMKKKTWNVVDDKQ